MRNLLVFCAFPLLLLPADLFANGPPPPAALRYLRQPDKKGKDEVKEREAKGAWRVNANVSVIYRHDLRRPMMIVPRKYVANIKDAEPMKKAEADGPGGRNLFAGLALSAAFISGGFWLMRRSGKALLVVAIVGALTFASVFVADLSGNAGPPWRFPTTPVELKADQSATLGMDMHIVDEGDSIQIVLPKELLPVTMVPYDVLSNRVTKGLPPAGSPKEEGPKKAPE